MKNYVKWEFEFKGKRIEFRFSSPRITLYKHNSDIYGRFENIFGNIYNWKENKELYDMRMEIIVWMILLLKKIRQNPNSNTTIRDKQWSDVINSIIEVTLFDWLIAVVLLTKNRIDVMCRGIVI